MRKNGWRGCSQKRRSREQMRAGRFKILLALILGAVLLPLLALAGVAAGVYAYYARDLPDPSAMQNREIAQTTKIYDRNGTLLYEVFDPKLGRRTNVSLADIALPLRQATIATEDADFYSNAGINFRGLLRAAVTNALQGKAVQGGSSITQQLVKNVLIPEEDRPKRSYSRKLKETILALEVTRKYTKDQVLEWYLNEMNYGNLSYGVEAAAQSYFGKSAKDLDLAESAMLAGLPQAPALYSPLIDPEAAKQRQDDVLDLMVRQGYITEEEAEEAKTEELHYAPQRFDIKAPHFVMYIRELLEKRYGRDEVYRGGLKVVTSLDMGMQSLAENMARAQVAKLEANDAHNASVVITKPQTGEILAMVGSVDYFDASIDGQVNVATSLRQPGSAIKPFNYLAAFMKGYTPSTMLLDVPSCFPDGSNPPYCPQNYDGTFRGPVSVRQALACSLNVPAVKTLAFAGIPRMIEVAHRMGITTFNEANRYGLALTLGGGEVTLLDLTYAFGVFANGGRMAGRAIPEEDQVAGLRRIEPVAILRVEDGEGNVLDDFTEPAVEQVASPQLCYLITNILSDNTARTPSFGPDSSLNVSRPAAVKTGTTTDWKDNWTVGYAPDLCVGVWVGNSLPDMPMRNVTGVTGAAPIWHDIIETIYNNLPSVEFAVPSGLVKTKVCTVSGMIATPACPNTRDEVFSENQVPKQKCNVHQSLKKDKRTGALADSGTPAEDVVEEVYTVLPPEASAWMKDAGVPVPPTQAGPMPVLGDVGVSWPLAGALVRGDVDVSGSASGPDFTSWRLEYGTGLSPGEWKKIAASDKPVSNDKLGSWSTNGLDGLYTLRLVVQKEQGVEETSVPVTVDNGAPSVKLVALGQGATLSRGSIALKAEASDPYGVVRVEFVIDGQPAGYAAGSSYTYTWEATTGDHTLQAVAYDAAGNKAESEKISVHVS